MIRAYITIKSEIGKVNQIFNRLKNIKEVVSIASTAGEFDIIMMVSVLDLEKLCELVTNNIHKIPGIIDTETHVIAKEGRNVQKS